MKAPIIFSKWLFFSCCLLLLMGEAKAVQLSGNYTIDSSQAASATNFKNFTSAVAYLTGVGSRNDGGVNNTAPFGVTSTVTFNVAAGTYPGQVAITGPIAGASAISPVIFNGGTGNAATRIITHAAASSSSRFTFQLNNVQYVQLRNLTILATGATHGWAVHMTGASSDYNQVKNCILEVSGSGTTSTAANYACLIVSGSNTGIDDGTHANYLEIDSNTTNYGRYGISVNGTSSDLGVGNKFRGNSTNNASHRGINIGGQNGALIERNNISLRATPQASSAGIYCYAIETSVFNRLVINANRITGNVGVNGIYFNSCSNEPSAKALVLNNFIGNGFKVSASNGIAMTGSNNVIFAHNTVLVDIDGTSATHGALNISYGCTGIDVMNNIFSNFRTGPGTVVYIEEQGYFDSLDYNIYYKAGLNKPVLTLWGSSYINNTYMGVGGFNTHSYTASKSPFVSESNLHITTPCNNGKDLGAYSSDPVIAFYLGRDIDGDLRLLTSGDIGADEFVPPATDLAVLSVLSPVSPAVPGFHDLAVLVRNNGASPITAFTLTYSNNAGTPKVLLWNGTLNTCETDTVVFTGADQVSIGTQNTIVAYATLAGDANTGNDTITTPISAGLNGNYTIGATGSDYVSFTAAVNDLKSRGITGSVTFTVAAGTYTEQVTLNDQVAGASALNTITFDGVASASRILTFAGTTNARHTFQVGSNYVMIRNMTIRGTGTFGWPVHITGLNLKNIKVIKCRVEITGTGANATSQNYSCIVINGSPTSATTGARIDGLEIDSNTTRAGYYGIICYGLSNNRSIQNQFRNNVIDSSHNTGLYIQNQDGVNVDHNSISRRVAATSGEGIRISNVVSILYRTVVNGNIIRQRGGSGILIDNSNHAADRKGICTNNLVGGDLRRTDTYGIQVNGSSYWYICHNTGLNDYPDGTSNSSSVFTSNSSSNLTLVNNIFAVSATSFSLPLYADNTATFDTIDYNLYHRADTANHTLIYIGAAYNSGNLRNAPENVNSLVKVPRFVSAANLRITEACNTGVALSSLFTDPLLLSYVATDIDGHARTAGPDMGAYEYTPLTNDLALTALVAPSTLQPFAAGFKDLVVTVQNNGAATVSSFVVKYNLNGNIFSETWSNPLAPCEAVTITFTGSKQIDLSAGGDVSIYTELAGENNYSNDTLNVSFTPGLSGPYTIGPSGNYTSFTAAVNALKRGGVLGPVVFTVTAGTYTEQVSINDHIKGISAINTITFDGVDSATRILSFFSSAINSRHTLWIASSYIRVKNLTIRATGSTYGWPVFLSNAKTAITDVQFTKCVFDITSAAGMNPTSESFIGMVISSSTSSAFNSVKADSVVIDSSTFNYGYYGVAGYGMFDMVDYSLNCRVSNNRFNTIAGTGINLSNYNNLLVENNTVVISKTSNFGSGIELSGLVSSGGSRNVVRNNVIYNTGAGGSGISLYQCINAPGIKGILANNMISGGAKGAGAFGLRLNQSTDWYVVHNSVNNDFNGGTNSSEGNPLWVNSFSASMSNISVFNNIFSVSKNSAAIPVYASGANLFDTLDYNIYYKADTASSGEILNINSTSYNVLNFTGAGGFNQNSLFRVPGFVNDTNVHMPLQNACANRLGFVVTDSTLSAYIAHDVDGDPRINQPLIGADEVPAPHALDIAVTKLASPVAPFSAGLYDLKVVLTNTGSQTLTSALVNYTVNGSGPVTAFWSGSLGQCDTAVFTVATQIPLNAGHNEVVISTYQPNGLPDDHTANDTLIVTLSTALSGAYTIGTLPTDSFPNFTTAVQALHTRGVGGPVLFEVGSGTYNEYILLNAVPGASATNPVTFQALHRDSAFVRYNSTGLHPNVVTLLGTSYVTFRNISFTQQNVTNYNAVYLTGNCSYDTFENCLITAAVPTVNLNYTIYGTDLSGKGLTFRNNTISGGGGGVYLRGLSASQLYSNMLFDRNTIQTTFFATVDVRFQDSLAFVNNSILISGARTNNDSYLLTCNHSLFANNVIMGSDFVSQPQFQVFGTSSGSHIYHNSFNLNNNNGAGAYPMNSPGGSIVVKNNAFTTRGNGYAASYYSLPAGALVADHNHYYGTGDLIRATTGGTYANLYAWKNASAQERHSVAYRAGFSSMFDLTPDANDSASWSLNGRAVHLDSVNIPFVEYLWHDRNGIARARTYAAGVPDIGAYEFAPVATAPAATAVPTTPAAGITQVFTFATDTVATLTWDQFAAVPASVVLRQYGGAIHPAAGTTGNATFFYVDAEMPAGNYVYQADFLYLEGWRGTITDETNSRLITRNPMLGWVMQHSSTVNAAANKLTGSFTSEWSSFTGTDVTNPLPVKWLLFNAGLAGNNVQLNWSTASERNNKGFTLERSADGRNFHAVTFVEGKGTTNTWSDYRHTDTDPFAALHTHVVYYRLQQVDVSGHTNYSQTVTLNRQTIAGNNATVYPNPYSDDLFAKIVSDNAQQAVVELFDVQGRLIGTESHTLIKGENVVNITGANNLGKGLYLVRITCNGTQQTMRLVKE